MAEVYVTLGEAAELERVKYNTMVKRVLRKQESFVTKTEKSENGGKDVVLVAVSSLSKQARNAWGRLKSGAGWISLSYTKKVAASTGTTFTPYLITTTCSRYATKSLALQTELRVLLILIILKDVPMKRI